jgi:hypothetical protein
VAEVEGGDGGCAESFGDRDDDRVHESHLQILVTGGDAVGAGQVLVDSPLDRKRSAGEVGEEGVLRLCVDVG